MSTKPAPTRRSVWRRRVGELVLLGVLGTGLATIAGWGGRWWWVLDLFAHFRVQYAAVCILALVVFALIRRWKSAALAAVVAGINIALIAPFYVTVKTAVPDGGALRLLSLNVHSSNDQHSAVVDLIREEDPDVVLLVEITGRLVNDLAGLEEAYPYSIVDPEEDDFGIGLWSRLPLRDAGFAQLGPAGVRSVVAQIDVGDGWVAFLGTHTVPPINGEYAGWRHAQLNAIAAAVGKRGDEPMVVAGDLNITPWSVFFRDLLRDGGLRDSMRGFGVQRTWPAWNWLMRIPIDQVLVTDEWFVKDRHVTRDVGSDHLGVVVDLVLRGGG